MSIRNKRSTAASLAGRASPLAVQFILLVSLALPAWPQEKPVDLTDQSLEDLMNIKVTSVSKDTIG